MKYVINVLLRLLTAILLPVVFTLGALYCLSAPLIILIVWICTGNVLSWDDTLRDCFESFMERLSPMNWIIED